jgi:hypothetical protein
VVVVSPRRCVAAVFGKFAERPPERGQHLPSVIHGIPHRGCVAPVESEDGRIVFNEKNSPPAGVRNGYAPRRSVRRAPQESGFEVHGARRTKRRRMVPGPIPTTSWPGDSGDRFPGIIRGVWQDAGLKARRGTA